MFCLMDVSGSMTEHMKDLAKRFYMLLYVFLTRRYNTSRSSSSVIPTAPRRWTRRRSSTSPATGGTMVSTALRGDEAIVARRAIRPAEWNIYAAQASDGDNSYSDGEPIARLLRDAILPVGQYFAYLEVGDDQMRHALVGRIRRYGRSIERLAPKARRCRMRKVQRAQRDLPGVPRAVPASRGGKGMSAMTDAANGCSRAPTGISRRCSGSTTPARRSRSTNWVSTSIRTRSR